MKRGYLQPSGAATDARVLAESRLSYALISSLFTGLSGQGSNLRYAMPVKTRQVDKPELTMDESQAIILGALRGNKEFVSGIAAGTKKGATQDEQANAAIALSFLDETGSEVLTKEGALAVFKGIAGGTTPIGSEALGGVYIDFDTRKQIQIEWMNELTQEGVDLGLSKASALQRTKNIWYGAYDGSSPGIGDILWSKDISYTKVQEYQQLNTTYIIGPDGTPWATGFTRPKLLGALGLAPLQRSYNSDDTNIDLDPRGNVADFAVGVNTGQRGLRRVDDSFDIPTDVEIGDTITKAIEELGDKDFASSGFNGYGRRRGYGGGGGGGGYAVRPNIPYSNMPRWFDLHMEAERMKTIYADSPYAIRTENVTLRREETKRQRFSSERGRLNQWQ